ncbi:hypothetical protein CTR2_R40460 [Comamonas thiooxydans]|uniref:hypothetical protein n=1 Tax=Comamonas thiooxydans TaxID=363952 RepID=UPI000A2D21BF|nr:hypothetical protein [Comamonas thiooxydans]BDR10708.1 hypothetical protein CTR2_R40460 [Comamonas thiooxydans]
MQNKITIADAPDCLNTNDKAMWVLGYEAAIEARGQCLHQIQEPAAADVLTSGAAALSEYLKTCEQHAIVPDIGGAFASAFTAGFNLSASQAALPKSEYLEGVNIPNLREALIFLGRENGVGEGEVGDKLAQYVNSVASGVLRKKATLREAPQAAPAAVAEPQDLRAAAQAALDWLEEDGLNLTHNVRENLRAALAATPAAPAAAAPVVLPEPDAPIKEVMTLVELHRQEIIKVMDEEGSLVDVQSAQDAIESKLRALLATATGLPAQAAKPSGLLTVDEYQAKYLHIHKMSDDERYGYESLYNEIVSGLQMPAAEPLAQAFQQRVQPWMMACFGAEISADRIERNHRFLEEALELVQSCGCTASEAHQLVDYVYGRPWGEPAQEAGGVMVTLAALCLANGLDMHACGETELARIWTKVEAIRAKQAAKPKHSPLPMHVAQADARDAESDYQRGYRHGYNRRDAEVQGALL